jgi:GNAT superfamily N-acetyltransferase
MEIMDFKQEHIPMAMQLVKENYEMAQRTVTILPEIGLFPEMEHFVENGLGVAVTLEDRLVGFLCSYQPREDAFGTTNVRGGYVPLHGHGVACDMDENSRDRIYSKLYQAAAEKWVNAGIRSHAITLYTHDRAGEKSFFYNGFGLRCLDLICALDRLPSENMVHLATGDKLDYVELFRDEWVLLLKHHNALIHHLGNSPSFMLFEPVNEEGLYKQSTEDVRYFAAKVNGKPIAYMKLSDSGENFATEVDDIINICGAYCEPEYRGTGIYYNLLCHVMRELKREGYRLLGVDCEGFNPTARGFWTKYFTEYTHSLVRRIDEKAVNEILKKII